jgi:hypothetical protein
MDTFSLGFTSGHWWLYLVLVAVATVAAIVTYRATVPMITSNRRALLVTLRAFALSALLITLFEPVLHIIRSTVQQPRVAVLIDRSRSVGLSDRSGDRRATLRAAQNVVLQALESRATVAVFDEGAEQILDLMALDTLQPRGARTDIAAALRWAGNQAVSQQVGAVVLISDGNSNTGDDPTAVAERAGMPLLAVGIGDSIPPADIVLQSIDIPAVAIVSERTTLSVDVTASGMQGRTYDVIVDDDGREIGRQRVDVRERLQRQTLVFDYTPATAGIRKITARVVAIDGEYSARNNVASDYIKVKTNRRGIVLLAGAPSPDVAFLSDALGTDPTVRLQMFVQRQGGGFYGEPPTPATFADASAVILVGFPTAATPSSLVSIVADAVRRDRALLFVSSQDLDYTKLGGLADVLPFTVISSRSREFPVTADVTSAAASDPIMRLGTDEDVRRWNDLPPLYRTETFVDVRPQATVLATQRLNGVPMGDPLIVARDDGERRQLAILGHGLYRWRLLGKGPSDARGAMGIDVLSLFVDNSVRWLSANADRQRVKIAATRAMYAAGEVVGFTATVVDASNVAVDDADVRVSVVGGGKTRDIVLAAIGNGRYRSDIGVVQPGDYQYTGRAKRGQTTIGTDAGRFSVGDVNVELLATTMNATLLRRLAEVTNGSFVNVDGIAEGLSKLLQDVRMAEKTVTEERDVALWSSWWFLALAIAAFATEWFLRKRSGLV